MASTKLIQQGGPPGNPPPVGTVVVYPKADEQLYFQGSDGVEHPLAGQVEAGILFKGSDGSTLAGGAGITSVVRNSAGNYTVTLIVPTTGDLMPRATPMDGPGNPRICQSDLLSPPPCSTIGVYVSDAAGTPTDPGNVLFNMVRLAT